MVTKTSRSASRVQDDLKQKLAAIEHQRWADWQEYMFDCAVTSGTDEGIGYRVLGWPKEQYDNWKRQIETPYAELSDKEKASDMEQVDRYWPLIEQQLQLARIEARLSSEIWLPYRVYPFNGEYEISSAGRVRRGGKILKTAIHKDTGYEHLSLSIRNTQITKRVHRLVAQTFLINSSGRRTVNHKDGIRTNNWVNNLEWATYSENIRYSYDVLGLRNHNAKLSDSQVADIVQRLAVGEMGKTLATEYCVDPNTITNIKKGRYYKNVTAQKAHLTTKGGDRE
jgi:hypothetical protein